MTCPRTLSRKSLSLQPAKQLKTKRLHGFKGKRKEKGNKEVEQPGMQHCSEWSCCSCFGKSYLLSSAAIACDKDAGENSDELLSAEQARIRGIFHF